MLIGLFVSRDQNNKDGQHFRKKNHLSDRHFASLLRYFITKTVVAEPELLSRFVWESGLILHDLASPSRAVTQIPQDQSHRLPLKPRC